jgi:hypothetical protein
MQKDDHQHRFRGLNWQFSWVLVNLCFAGIKQEKSQRGPTRRTKKHILCGNQLEKTLEDTRRRPTDGGPIWHRAWPVSHPRAHLSAAFVRRSSTTLRIAFMSLIKVGLIRGLWFVAPAYINSHVPPEAKAPWNPNSYSLIRINWEGSHKRINLSRASIQEKISPH